MSASIYERALGPEFAKLHPRIRERFGFSSRDGIASIGQGVMEQIWYSRWAAVPLHIGTFRHIMFPQSGCRVPFTIENYGYRDRYGRETVSWIRSFQFPNRTRRFDATMIFSRERDGVVDYLGNKQHLVVDLELSVEANGGLRIRSGDQRFYEGGLQFRFPRRFTGTADVCEWYDEDDQLYRISVEVTNPLIGPVFSYRGAFQARFIETRHAAIPAHIKPLREEARE